MCLLVVFANHRDAIANGFITPAIHVAANGELEIDERFYSTVLTDYFTKRGLAETQRAAANYDTYFPAIETVGSEAGVNDTTELERFDEYFRPEFGFSIHLYFKVRDELRALAVKSGTPASILREDAMIAFLNFCGFMETEAEAFINHFTLPIRSGWDQNMPPRCRSEDVYPWRFRRQLSLNMRPFVQVQS
jgi:hypothetical protein